MPQANRRLRRFDDLPTQSLQCPIHREENNGVAGMTTDEPPTDLTALMSLDPLDLTKQDLDKVIAYQRKQRPQRASSGGFDASISCTPNHYQNLHLSG